MLSEPLGVTEE